VGLDTLASGERVDRAFRARNVNRLRLGERSTLDFGLELELARSPCGIEFIKKSLFEFGYICHEKATLLPPSRRENEEGL
jgi:hypothetical protein